MSDTTNVETSEMPPKVVTTSENNSTMIDPFSLSTTFERISELIRQDKFTIFDDQLVARIDLIQQVGSILLPESAQSETNTATIVLAADNIKADFPRGAHIIPVQSGGRSLCENQRERLVLYDVKTEVHALITDEAEVTA